MEGTIRPDTDVQTGTRVLGGQMLCASFYVQRPMCSSFL